MTISIEKFWVSVFNSKVMSGIMRVIVVDAIQAEWMVSLRLSLAFQDDDDDVPKTRDGTKLIQLNANYVQMNCVLWVVKETREKVKNANSNDLA